MSFLSLFADDAAPKPPDLGWPFNSPTFPFAVIAMLFLFWIVVLRPMSRREKAEQEAKLASIKRGSKVLTNAGIVAVVVTAKDGEDEIVVKSEDSKLRIKRSVVVQVLGTDEAEAAKG
jgi:preprotein translocase subunit YajC